MSSKYILVFSCNTINHVFHTYTAEAPDKLSCNRYGFSWLHHYISVTTFYIKSYVMWADGTCLNKENDDKMHRNLHAVFYKVCKIYIPQAWKHSHMSYCELPGNTCTCWWRHLSKRFILILTWSHCFSNHDISGGQQQWLITRQNTTGVQTSVCNAS